MIAKRSGRVRARSEGPMYFEVRTRRMCSRTTSCRSSRETRAAEKAFRKWMHDDMMKSREGPHQDRGQSSLRGVAGLRRASMLASGCRVFLYPFLGAGGRCPIRRARFTSQDLVEAATFKQAYYDRVTHFPELEGAEEGHPTTSSPALVEMKSEHLERIVGINGEHPVVRRVAGVHSATPGARFREKVEFMVDILQHPQKRMNCADRQDELSTVCPDLYDLGRAGGRGRGHRNREAREAQGHRVEMLPLHAGRRCVRARRAAVPALRGSRHVGRGASRSSGLNRAKFAGKLAAGSDPEAAASSTTATDSRRSTRWRRRASQQASEVAYGPALVRSISAGSRR